VIRDAALTTAQGRGDDAKRESYLSVHEIQTLICRSFAHFWMAMSYKIFTFSIKWREKSLQAHPSS
jgi:hypothetical protein